MSALAEINQRCAALYEDLNFGYAREWKAAKPGRKVVGHMPFYVPRELIHAAGALPLGIFGGMPDFSQNFFQINNSKFLYGEFINALLAFLIVALVLYYLVVVPVNRLMDMRRTEEPAGPKTRECPECLSKVPVAARRCAFCTSVLEPERAAVTVN